MHEPILIHKILNDSMNNLYTFATHTLFLIQHQIILSFTQNHLIVTYIKNIPLKFFLQVLQGYSIETYH